MSKFLKTLIETIKNNDNNEVFVNMVNDNLNDIISKMISTVADMPYLSDLKEMIPIYNYVKIISFSCVGGIVGYKGLKLLLTNSEIDIRSAKNIFNKLGYSLIFSTLSIKYIDILIYINNTLSKFMLNKFNVSSVVSATGTGILIPCIFFVFETTMIIKVLIGFWMRMAELVFAGIISPAVFTMWINDEWSGYLSGWLKRVSYLVFAQVSLVLILIIYAMIMKGWTTYNSINHACLSVAMLLLLNKGPKILQDFSGNSEYTDAKNVVMKLIKSQSRIAKKISKMKSLKGE